jgi:hypothetical protein
VVKSSVMNLAVVLLTIPTVRRRLETDLTALIESEIANKTGVEGVAIRSLVQLVTRKSPTFIATAVSEALPRLVRDLEAQYDTSRQQGISLSSYLCSTAQVPITLTIFERAFSQAIPRRAILVPLYTLLRPRLRYHLQLALPAVATVLAKYL